MELILPQKSWKYITESLVQIVSRLRTKLIIVQNNQDQANMISWRSDVAQMWREIPQRKHALKDMKARSVSFSTN